MKYLLDSNIIIYHLKGEPIAMGFIDNYFRNSCISFITVIEVLSFNHSEQEAVLIKKLLSTFVKLNVNDELIEKTVILRKNSKIKLPDCIIAATAINNNLTLVTRNCEDFKHFEGLKILNPFSA
ncbi:MAG: type II toxin-antitoxin system VapC family toxin [Lentisphaerota bacterium]